MSKVGIYAPSYNVKKYIGEMIESIKNQTFEDWELAILDDSSIDASYEEALKYRESRIIVEKNNKHSGKIGYIKNKTTKLFKGKPDYYASVDADDLIPPETLEIFVNFMDNHPNVGAACGNFICFDDTGNRWSFPHVANSGDFDPDILLKYMNFFPLRFVRREIFEQVGGYDETLTSAIDYDLALRLVDKTTIRRITEPVSYLYRQHDIQVSTRARPEQDLNAKMALEAALKRRQMDYRIVNNKPPFVIEPNNSRKHFIWGKHT